MLKSRLSETCKNPILYINSKVVLIKNGYTKEKVRKEKVKKGKERKKVKNDKRLKGGMQGKISTEFSVGRKRLWERGDPCYSTYKEIHEIHYLDACFLKH